MSKENVKSGILLILIFLIWSCEQLNNLDNNVNETDTEEIVEEKTEPEVLSGDKTRDMLIALGVKIDDESVREDVNNNSVDSSLNPLGSIVTTLYKESEIFVSGAMRWTGNFENSGSVFIGKDSTELLGSDSDNSWTKFFNKNIAVDLDIDGYDEIVAMFYDSDAKTVNVRELSINKNSFQNKFSKSQTDILSVYGMQNRQSITSGDLTGDGLPEIVFVNSTLMVILDSKYNEILSRQLTPQVDSTNSCIRVLCSDLDRDGVSELILLNGTNRAEGSAEITIYHLNNGSLNPVQSFFLNNSEHALTSADMTSGDFDGDGLLEVAFSGDESGTDKYQILVMDSYMNSESKIQFKMLNTSIETYGYHWITPIVSGDLDNQIDEFGNFRDEIVCFDDIVKLNKNSNLELVRENCIIAPYPDMLAVGDIDGDFKLEIISSTKEDFKAYKFSAAGTLDVIINIDCWSNGLPGGSVSVPDINHDSSILKYVDHQLKYTDPRIIAVISAPPAWEDTEQNLENTSLEYGTSKSSGAETSHTAGLKVMASVGVSLDCPLWGSAGGLEAKWTVTNSFSWAFNNGKEINLSVGYGSAPGEDKVIFSCIPFDVYTYEIISSPKGSDPSVSYKEGEKSYTVISVPRKSEILSVSKEFYNKFNGDGLDVDSGILSSKPGDPFSYPAYSEVEKIKSTTKNRGLFSSNTQGEYLTVGQGNGFQTLSIEEITSSTQTFDYSLEVDYEIETVIATMLQARGIGFEYGYSYSTSVSSGTSVSLSLGDITNEGDYNSGKKYKTGLMVYPLEVEDQQKFTMVTCWVEK